MPAQPTVHTFSSLEQSWDPLVPDCDVKAFFLSHRWQRLWWENFGQGRELLLLAFQQDGETIGIAPLQRQDDTISFLGDTDLFDFHDFIIPQGYELDFYRHLRDYLLSQDWRSLYFPSLSHASPTLRHLPLFAEQQGWTCTVEQEDVSPTLALPGEWDEYLPVSVRRTATSSAASSGGSRVRGASKSAATLTPRRSRSVSMPSSPSCASAGRKSTAS